MGGGSRQRAKSTAELANRRSRGRSTPSPNSIQGLKNTRNPLACQVYPKKKDESRSGTDFSNKRSTQARSVETFATQSERTMGGTLRRCPVGEQETLFSRRVRKANSPAARRGCIKFLTRESQEYAPKKRRPRARGGNRKSLRVPPIY